MKEKLEHTVVIETTRPDGSVECRVQRFRTLPIPDMDDALVTVHSWEDGINGMWFRNEDEFGKQAEDYSIALSELKYESSACRTN